MEPLVSHSVGAGTGGDEGNPFRVPGTVSADQQSLARNNPQQIPSYTTSIAQSLNGNGENFNASFFPGANTNNLAPTDFAALTTAADFGDHAGLGPRNAGRNPVVRAKLQLNGHDRFQERLGSYFNLVQPYQFHTNVPSTGINVYSFGLKPEEHQPSGTCNMSRIDNCTLQLQLTPLAALGSKIRVYATNYNVLRIMSGMGGLAYSN